MSETPKYIIPNLKNALDVLMLIADAPKGLSAVDIESTLMLPRTTVFRILRTLQHSHFIEKKSNRYHTGTSLLQIGLSAANNIEIRRLAVPILEILSQNTGFTAHLAVPSGYESLIIEVFDSPGLLRVASRPGTRVPMHCSSTGKIFLSFLLSDRLKEYVSMMRPQKLTKKTITETKALEMEIRRIQGQGYAIDDGEFHRDIRCLAAPVFDAANNVLAAIGITAPATQFTTLINGKIRESVLNASSELSERLGAKPGKTTDRMRRAVYPAKAV